MTVNKLRTLQEICTVWPTSLLVLKACLRVWFQKIEAQCMVLPLRNVRMVACRYFVSALLGVDLLNKSF